jgi:hypothetical protein
MEKNMKKIIISRTNLGKTEEKEIYELEVIDSFKYRLLGQAVGISIGHCVQMGLKNKENFWNRVYGYKIIKNEELESKLLDAMRTVKSDVKEYITVSFYERLSDQKLMFVPKRLEIPEHPELYNFPYNIMFGTVVLFDDSTQNVETSVYNPDLSTFREEGDEQKMKYFNRINRSRKYWIEIVYNTKKNLGKVQDTVEIKF